MSRTPLRYSTPNALSNASPSEKFGTATSYRISEAGKGAGPAQHMRMRPLGCPRTAFHALISYEYDRIEL